MGEKGGFNMTDETKDTPRRPEGAAPGATLTPAARRALDEAAARRKAEKPETRPKEVDGPKGEEPTRYGDWERGGRAVDF